MKPDRPSVGLTIGRKPFVEFADTVFRSYGAVLFSNRRASAALFLLATFYDPFIGALGFVGNVIANAVAFSLHTDRSYTRAGIFGINGILVGLAVGLYLPHSGAVFPLLVLGASLSSLIALSLLSSLTRRRQLPVMSIPFVLTVWLILLAVHQLKLVEVSPQLFPPAGIAAANQFLADQLPRWLRSLIREFGSTLFQPTVASGLLIVLGILITSRITLLFGVFGALIGLIVYGWVGGVSGGSGALPFGMNYVLIAMALGGFFLAPTISMALYAMFGVAVGVVVVNGTQELVHSFDLPLLIAPFNIVVVMLLYPLRSQIIYAARAGLIPIPLHEIGTPEHNLRWYKERFGKRAKVRCHLPFYGTWYVMQGEHGKHTHKGTQAHAYDFIVVDENSKSFRGLGLTLEDYYTFGLPVLAPAGGKVLEVLNDVPDNQPGVLNEAQNWGNYIILDHGNGEYAELSHFKQGSICVQAGDRIEQGQVLGQCGNSGYSSQPHIHIQRQKGSFLGAETVRIRFEDVIIRKEGEVLTHPSTILPEGAFVSTRL